MGKRDKKQKGKGSEKTAAKTEKNAAAKQKKLLAKIGESNIKEVVAKLEEVEAHRKTITEELCAPPSPRSSFTLVAHPLKEEIILFGGEFYNGQRVCVYNDLFIYNINKNEWKQIHSPQGPAPRSGHQMVAVATDNGQLWLFGGEYASPSQLQFYHYKDLWSMNLKTRQWEKINAPNGPSPRSGHRMVSSKKSLVVFGGFHDNNQSYLYYNDVHIFSLESYSWLKIDVSGPIVPSPRSGCCMTTTADGQILIWGGYSKIAMRKNAECGTTHTDMFALIPEKNSPITKFKWSVVKPRGYKPLPRSSVAACSAATNSEVYCFGGVMDTDEDEEDIQSQFGDELLVLNSTSYTWRLLEIGKIPAKDSTASQTTKDSNGADAPLAPSVTTTTDGIFTVTVSGPSTSSAAKVFGEKLQKSRNPSPRMKAGLCVCKRKLYMFGGLYEVDNKQLTYNDFYVLDLNKLDEWKVLIANNSNTHEWIESESSDSEDSENSEECSESSDGEDSDSSKMDTD